MSRGRKKREDIEIIIPGEEPETEIKEQPKAAIKLGDTIYCCNKTFVLNTPKGNRCAVCNKRYYPDDSQYKP